MFPPPKKEIETQIHTYNSRIFYVQKTRENRLDKSLIYKALYKNCYLLKYNM